MELPISRQNTVRNRNKSIRRSIPKRRALYAVEQVTKQDLTPLQRLKKFKKLQEKQAKVQKSHTKEPGVKRVTFADEMTSEVVAVNGSHEKDLDNDEKILKPRKSILSNDHVSPLQNGNNENGSVSDNTESGGIENGNDADIQNGEASKSDKRSLRQKNLHEKREGTPTRQSLPRETKIVKEPTPKPETPNKREKSKPRGTPAKVNSSESNPELSVPKLNDGHKDGSERRTAASDEHVVSKNEESIAIVGDGINESKNVNSIAGSEEDVVKEKPQEKSFFSAFRRISRSSLETKDTCEASSSSVCLDSSSIKEANVVPSGEIKGRKPINSFSRFPGRNVSITSLDKSLKRKANESFEEEEDRKRFAGETASGSEKSPGWSFFSPSLRVWSPPQAPKTYLPTSTPFHKREEQDSMAVNYDSKTKLDLDESIESDALSSQQKANKWCTIM
ncbi:THO complex subunit 2-like isoform X1 [Macrosteles quadrilineatus]|uniref:THO complex subunit 2-like isoform X1 n=2 Tax=Macrosteles quadrilineatus TaxID=74068 RepID=UPI0023E11E73|nr:THO complex subunit 2-like isoform X1 [Macrosteles quadrilineatus]